MFAIGVLQVLFAFMVGLHNLYWYYGSQTYKHEETDKLVHTSEAFQGLVAIYTCIMLKIQTLGCGGGLAFVHRGTPAEGAPCHGAKNEMSYFQL